MCGTAPLRDVTLCFVTVRGLYRPACVQRGRFDSLASSFKSKAAVAEPGLYKEVDFF